MAGPIRLRTRRSSHARRRSVRSRLLITGGFFAVLIGAACLAPLAPTALAPSTSADDPVMTPPVLAAVAAPVPQVAVVAPTAPVAPAARVAVVTPAPTATPLPTPVVIPTLTANGQNLLAAIRTDRTAQWVKNTAETPLHSGPSDDSTVFTRLPQWSLLEQIDSRPDWLEVQYSGDGDTRQPGPGWVKASDVGAVDAPTAWLRTAKATILWSTSDASGKRVEDVPAGDLMELVNADIVGSRVHVRLPGDGRSVPPSEGWLDGDSITRAASPTVRDLPWAYPEDLKADVRVNVPYRTQLDGSDYSGANCGPTVLGMALESFGVNLQPSNIRGQVLTSENFDPTDTDAGSYIWALADVAREDGVQAHGLYDADGTLHHWTVDDIRNSLKAKQPVILQVVYRGLPGRSESGYYGDHYIIITGLLGDQFLYNDPIGGPQANEAPGYDRVMTAAQLQRAMRASDTGYAYSGFALTQN
jgi:Peptidase_C39 like family